MNSKLTIYAIFAMLVSQQKVEARLGAPQDHRQLGFYICDFCPSGYSCRAPRSDNQPAVPQGYSCTCTNDGSCGEPVCNDVDSHTFDLIPQSDTYYLCRQPDRLLESETEGEGNTQNEEPCSSYAESGEGSMNDCNRAGQIDEPDNTEETGPHTDGIDGEHNESGRRLSSDK